LLPQSNVKKDYNMLHYLHTYSCEPKPEMVWLRLYAILVVAAAASSIAAFSPSSTSLPPQRRAPRGGDGGTVKRPPLPSMSSSSSSSSNAMNDYDDFADFSSTQLAPMSSQSSSSSMSDDAGRGGGVTAGNGNGNVDDPFFSSLISRVREVREKSERLVSLQHFHRRPIFVPSPSSTCGLRGGGGGRPVRVNLGLGMAMHVDKRGGR
jgi:hypothetical protein